MEESKELLCLSDIEKALSQISEEEHTSDTDTCSECKFYCECKECMIREKQLCLERDIKILEKKQEIFEIMESDRFNKEVLVNYCIDDIINIFYEYYFSS
jgi:uncharacterized protein YacL (UPF0231 family)